MIYSSSRVLSIPGGIYHLTDQQCSIVCSSSKNDLVNSVLISFQMEEEYVGQ